MKNKIEIKKIYKEIQLDQKKLNDFIVNTRLKLVERNVENEIKIFEEIIEKISEYKANSNLISLLADFLELCDDKFIIDNMSLLDIEKLLKINIKYQKYDISFYEDIIYYYWNVQDDAKLSKHYIRIAIKNVKNKLIGLENLLSEKENEID